MIWSRLSLTRKLFVAIVLPVLLAVALMAGAVMLSMRAGFSQYLLEAELSRFDGLAEVLAQDPTAAQGWPALAPRAAWGDLLARQVPLPLRREPERHALPPPPDAAPQGRPPIQPLPDRLILLDSAGTVRAGSDAPAPVYAERDILDAQGQRLGALRLLPFGQEQAEADALFLARQVWFTAFSALVAIAVAAAVAAAVARQFLRPIRAVGRHVARLAAGDLSARLSEPAAQDELGQMMHDQNRLAETLEQAQKRERQWVSDSSHELKTPLAVMQAQIEAMQDGLRPMNAGSLATLHGAVRRLARLTGDLAILARGDESAPLDLMPLDLAELAGQAALDMTPQMERAGLALTLDLPDIAVPVLGDAQRLRQVLDNLLDNALHYTRAPGRVALRCQVLTETALLILEDSAPAPPDPDLPRLFERFTRVETSRARAHGGSGLGLAICHSLVLAHGGQIAALPSDLGGLCIRITLPLEPAHEPYSDR